MPYLTKYTNSIHTCTLFLCQNENSKHGLRNVFNVAIFLLNQFNENDIHLEEEKLLAVSNLSVIGEFFVVTGRFMLLQTSSFDND